MGARSRSRAPLANASALLPCVSERERGRWVGPVPNNGSLWAASRRSRRYASRSSGTSGHTIRYAVFERLAVWAAARASNIEPLFLGLRTTIQG